MKLLAIIGFLLISLISCSPPKDDNGVYKIYHEPKPIRSGELDKIIKEMSIVPLETRKECLIEYYNSFCPLHPSSASLYYLYAPYLPIKNKYS